MGSKLGYIGFLALSSVFLGPILLAFRANAASPIEKFFYVTMTGPLVLVVIYFRYAESKKKAHGELDPQVHRTRLKELKTSLRKLALIVSLASIVAAVSAAWFLFILNQ